MNEDTIYKKAFDKWGELQYILLFEEMAELTKEITKELRGKGDKNAILEEIADVQIMIDQMKLHFGKEKCEKLKQVKLSRLSKLVQ